MNVLKLQKKFPVLEQNDLFGIIEDFRNIDLEDKGWVEKKMSLTPFLKKEIILMIKQEKH